MRQLSRALRSALLSRPEIVSSVQGIYYRRAPQDTPPPYLIFQKIWGRNTVTFETDAPSQPIVPTFEKYIYLVKAITLPTATMGSHEQADYLIELSETVLNRPTLNTYLEPLGWSVTAMWQERTFEYDVAYADIQIKYDYIQGGEVFGHAGVNYAIWVQKV